MAKDIFVFKLVNGDEIVGTVSERMEGTISKMVIHKPRQMVVQNTKQGPQAGLVPWVLSTPDCDFPIEKEHYFAAIPAPKEICDYYLEITSGIALVG